MPLQGIDDEAHVANFVESEQIVKAEGKVFSFVQLRGSSEASLILWTALQAQH